MCRYGMNVRMCIDKFFASCSLWVAPRARGRGRGRGRGRKSRVIESDEEPSPEQSQEDIAEAVEKTEDAPVQPIQPSVEEKENEVVPPPTSK